MTQLRSLIRAELTKLLSLRSTVIALGLCVAGAVALTCLFGLVAGATWDDWGAEARARFDPAADSQIGGILSALILTVLGVTAATSEYSSRTIALTLTANPRRGHVVLAKVAVITGVTLAAALLGNVLMFAAGQAWFGSSGLPTAGVLDGGTLRTVLGGAALAPVLPLLGLAAGLALRGAASAVIAVVLFAVGPPFLSGVLPAWWDRVLDFQLLAASDSLTNAASPTDLAPAAALLLVAAWLALLLGGAWALLERRDA